MRGPDDQKSLIISLSLVVCAATKPDREKSRTEIIIYKLKISIIHRFSYAIFHIIKSSNISLSMNSQINIVL